MLSTGTKFVFQYSLAAKDMLLREGIDYKYGARHLKRSIERFLVYPLSNLVATGQVGLGDLVNVDLNQESGKLIFSKRSGGALIHDTNEPQIGSDDLASKSDGIGLPIPQTKVARRGHGRSEKSEG